MMFVAPAATMLTTNNPIMDFPNEPSFLGPINALPLAPHYGQAFAVPLT